MTTLPDKPSELIRIALKDLEACELDPKYQINMNSWHATIDGKCAVCLAGAVMARTLGISPTRDVAPEDLESDLKHRLCALDCLRTGRVQFALHALGIAQPPKLPETVTTVDYHQDPNDFKNDMFDLATLFEWHGL